ncbi:MAG TPA: MerR family transcriptional regulator [Candidatus Ruania gallistercoris]|uniref:MerR family transcriptional regulator n=1 Tax=Candidatus Ruania gallistercoris TaxID=2838746 RepID=A0A9D2J567_9MICO|nr:MerR family transcriptional regulator [Candidatus Ruania gallistercoris]
MPDQDGSEALMHIGVVAERTELSIRTLRHYDEVGLVPPSARSEGGFRLYTEADVDRLRTIRRMKPLGFSLEEMRQLLAAISVLRAAERSDADLKAAEDVLATCGNRVRQSSERLRRHLAYAEELTALLDEISGRAPSNGGADS